MELSLPTRGLLGGRYQVEEPLGWGGAGEVWQGRHVELGSRVAIKLLRPGLALGERARRRFLNEARVMAQLNTSHAIRVHDVGVSEEGVPFLVMELVDGESLAQRLRRERRLQPGTTARLLGQAARGLERAHAMGIVHRDFKPANVLLSVDEDGFVRARVTDFGVAKLLRSIEEDAEAPPKDAKDTSATGVVGTPYYMAPEQFSLEKPVSPQTDVWALGVVAYECLTGRRPFEGETVEEVREAILRGRASPPSSVNPALPRALDGWFARACARDPEERFSSARFAVEALSDALEVSVAMVPPSAISAQISLLEQRRAESIDPLARTQELRDPPPAPSLPPRSAGLPVGLALLAGAALASLFWAGSRAVPGWRASVPAPPVAAVSAAPAPAVSAPPPASSVAEVLPSPAASTSPLASVSAPAPVASVVPRKLWPSPPESLPAEYRPFPEIPAPPKLPASFKSDPYDAR
jgi:serine/threonine-protein kinase